MAASRSARRTYRQIGVLLPLERDDADHDRVIADAKVPQNDDFMNDGFLFVKGLQMGPYGKFIDGRRVPRDQSVFVVQSASTGELFVNKLIERTWYPDTMTTEPPLELRASTYRHKIGDSSIDVAGNPGNGPGRKGVLPNVPFFNKLRFWQELDPSETHDVVVYSLFFEYCNGGSLEEVINKYQARLIAIPEHFIWLVAEQLFLALVAMKYGRHLVRDHEDHDDDESQHGSESDDDPAENWAPIYHRDLHANNVFINYIPKGPGRLPKQGLANNAFPEIVVGDFGNSGIEGDDPAILPACVYQPTDDDDQDDEGFLADWEDIFSVGQILRTMVMTHSDQWDVMMRPDCVRAQDVNQEPTAPPYSDDLIQLLQLFEFPNMDTSSVRDLGAAIDTTFPSPEDVRDTLLPQAQAKVAGYLNRRGKPAGYFDQIDVSWTRPAQLMPFSYDMRHAAEAGDGPDGGPPPDSDAGSEGDHSDGGSGDGSGNGDGGDVEMSDSPASEASHDGNDQPDDGPQQPEHPGGGDDDNHDGDDDDDDDDDHDDGTPSPPPATSEQLAMRQLRKLHKWNASKPRYELRSLDFGVPTITPLKLPP